MTSDVICQRELVIGCAVHVCSPSCYKYHSKGASHICRHNCYHVGNALHYEFSYVFRSLRPDLKLVNCESRTK